MAIYKSRIFQVGPFAVGIKSDERVVGASLAELFDGFDDADDKLIASANSFLINVKVAGPGRYQADVDGAKVTPPSNVHGLALAVTRHLNRRVLDAEVDCLHLHAGAVTRGGSTVLVVGSSQAGKSTLVAKLVTEGWSYLSDEQIGVTTNGELVPFQRPVTLRSGSWKFFDADLFPRESEERLDRIEVGPHRLGSIHRGAALAPTVVVCPDLTLTSGTMQALPVAETVARMLSESLDLERAGDTGVASMLAIAALAPGFVVGGKDLDATCQLVDQLCETTRPAGAAIERDLVAESESSDRKIGTHSWLFPDGSAALYVTDTGHFLQFDEMGYRAWQMVGTEPTSWLPELATSAFVAELRSIGALASR